MRRKEPCVNLGFTVPGAAVPWDKDLNKQQRHVYKPREVKEWQEKVRQHAFVAINADRGHGTFPVKKDVPIALEIIVYTPRPKDAPKWLAFPTTPPDATNMQKAIEDALKKLVYPDDAQVVSPCTHKRFCGSEIEAHVRIRVWEAGRLPSKWMRRQGGDA